MAQTKGQLLQGRGCFFVCPISDSNLKNFIRRIFNNVYSNFVVQEAKGAGGQKNYFMSSNENSNILSDESYVLVTPYFEKKKSVNIHIVTDGKCYRILPPSLQITINKFKYSGSDFVAYYNLPEYTKEKIIICAKKVAKKIISLGAKGIFGIDVLIMENDILFLECNYRYQGSSFILNKALIECGYPSLFEMRYNSFYNNLNNIPCEIYGANIPYSTFRRTGWNKHIKLPNPLMLYAINDSAYATKDQYIQYEIFNKSIIRNIEKQEEHNLY